MAYFTGSFQIIRPGPNMAKASVTFRPPAGNERNPSAVVATGTGESFEVEDLVAARLWDQVGELVSEMLASTDLDVSPSVALARRYRTLIDWLQNRAAVMTVTLLPPSTQTPVNGVKVVGQKGWSFEMLENTRNGDILLFASDPADSPIEVVLPPGALRLAAYPQTSTANIVLSVIATLDRAWPTV